VFRNKMLYVLLVLLVFVIPQGVFGVDETKVPTTDEIMQWIDDICAGENRRPGEPGDLQAEDYIYDAFVSFGLSDIGKEPVEITKWRADSWSLVVSGADGDVEIPSFYTLNTGFTPEEGVTGELVYLCGGSAEDFEAADVSGKIAVIDMGFATLPVFPLLLLKSYFLYDPDKTFSWWDSQPATWARTNWNTDYLEEGGDISKSAYDMAIKEGAVGVVWILKDQPTNINSYYAPYDGVMKELPALYLGKYDGQMLKDMMAQETPSATLVLTGTMSPGVMHNIHGVLPGKSDEIILISSHHDAPFKGYIEDGTGMGMVLSLAKYFSQVPESEREKTLVFFASAGHFYGSKGIEAWLEEHSKDYVEDAVLNLNIEHVAARDFQENDEGEYEDSGLMQTRGWFISNNSHYRDAIRNALNANELGRSLVVTITALGKEPPGEARFTNRLGIPIIHYISGPTYLLVDADTRDKVNPDELVPAARTFIEIVEELSLLSEEELAAEAEEE